MTRPGPGQVAVRATGVLAVGVALVAAGAMGGLVALAVVVAALAAWRPDPVLVCASLLVVVGAWVLTDRDAADWRTLLLALAVLVEHTCLVVAGAGPLTAAVPRDVVRRAARRAAPVGALTVVLWGAVALVARAAPPVPLGVVLAALVAVALVVAVTARA